MSELGPQKTAVGAHVLWFDEHNQPHNALVTAVHSNWEYPSINVVVVNPDPNQYDSYGQKIQRETSVPHRSHQAANGRYWDVMVS